MLSNADVPIVGAMKSPLGQSVHQMFGEEAIVEPVQVSCTSPRHKSCNITLERVHIDMFLVATARAQSRVSAASLRVHSAAQAIPLGRIIGARHDVHVIVHVCFEVFLTFHASTSTEAKVNEEI